MHPLEQRLAQLRRRVRRLVALWGASRLAAVVLGALLALGAADYLIRFDDPGIRLINSLVLAGLVAWGSYRYLFRSLSARWGELRLANEVQRRFPVLGDRLAVAIEFLRQSDDDPTAGSSALRRAVIAQTTAEAAAMDFTTALDPRPAVRAGVAAIGLVLVAAILAALDPVSSRVAVARLISPLGSIAWPQQTHLELRRVVEQVARGQAFEVEVVAAPPAELPAEARIHYRFPRPDGGDAIQTERMRRQGGAMIARRENVTRPFSYRVEGGDDRRQPWIDVKVIEPPDVQTLSVRLTPPPYTGWPPYESNKQIRALAGTRAEFRGAATKPLASAGLVLDDGRTIAAELTGSHQFQVPPRSAPPVVLDRSGDYGLVLTDRQGVSSGQSERWEIRVVPDSPPSAAIEQPAGNLYVTPRGIVPLRVTAKDDLAVAAVELVFNPSPSAGGKPGRAVLYRGPERPPQQAAFSPAPALPAIEYRWDLGPLGLARGAGVTFALEARDYAGATGRSEPRRLIVVTPEELLERIAQRQSQLAAELGRVLKIERESRTQIGGLEVRLGEAGRLDQLDVDHLQAAALGHRQAERGLADRGDGAAMHIVGILADLENNRLDAPDVTHRMEALLAEITRLQREHLPQIDQQLTAAIKSAQIRLDQGQAASPGAADPLATALAETARGQDQVLRSLEQMSAQLGQWESYRRYHRELAELVGRQEELARRAVELGRQTIGRDLKDLLPQQAAELRVLARGQLELSLRLDEVQDEMRRAAAGLAESDPSASANLADAAEEAQRRAVGARMRSVRVALDANQMGQAIDGQKQVVADLRHLLAILSGRKQAAAEGLLERLEEVARKLRARQQNLLQRTQRVGTEQVPPAVDSLAREQRSLGEETEQSGKRLGGGTAFGLALQGAADDMAGAARLLESGQAAEPTRQAQQSAVARLSLLLEALAPESTVASAGQGTAPGGQQQPAGATINVSELKLLRLMQQDVLARTRQLDQVPAKDPAVAGELSREQGRLVEMILRLLAPVAEEGPK